MLSKLTERLFFPILLLVTVFTNAQVKPMTADARLKGMRQREVLKARSILDSVKFRNIGPSIMSGRVVDVDANPSDPTEFYVAYASGGLWYTNNNGQSFTPVFDSAEVITIGDIAVNWKTRTIWVGTGEVNSSRSSYAGIGIYKSKDNGKTWHYLGLPESQHIGKIQLHPTDDNIAWVAALGHLYSPNKERGVYKTTDGGATWKQTLFVDDNTGAVDIDINPVNPNEVYAATWYKTRSAWNFEEGGKTSGIYKSLDGGNTWSLLTKQGAGFPVGEGVGRIGIAVYPKNPQIVYAIVDNNFHKPDTAKKDTVAYVLRDFQNLTKEQFLQLEPKKLDSFLRRNRMYPRYTAQMIMERVSNETLKPTAVWDYFYDGNPALFETPIIGAEVYRSEDGGQSWKKTNKKDLPTLYNTYGYYFGKIFVSPYNDQKIIITGFDLQMSTDGGKTFSTINKENTHADHHAAWIDPQKDSHIIIGNDGGCNLTYDNGQHWFKANTPAVGQFYSVFVDNAKPYNVYGGLQDNG
ncbi:MAG: WD40/YVTN/BNR-like repeat-containing protein, partial [Flavisolibacter sp.]